MADQTPPMRPRAEIKAKLRQAIYRRYKRVAGVLLRRQAESCAHRAIVEGPDGYVSLCSRQCATVCAPGAFDRSGECGDLFEYRWTKESLQEEFRREMAKPPADLMSEYPDIAVLRWVLAAAQEAEIEPDLPAPAPDEPAETTPAEDRGLWSWLRRIW